MNWKIDEAQQKFSELIGAAVEEPQLIFNQDKLVAAVVEAELFQDFLAWLPLLLLERSIELNNFQMPILAFVMQREKTPGI